MKILANMHPVSVLVIILILALFTVALVMLFAVCKTYRRQVKLAQTGDTHRSRVMYDALEDFTAALTEKTAESRSSISKSVESHLMACAIEKARTSGTVVDMAEYRKSLK